MWIVSALPGRPGGSGGPGHESHRMRGAVGARDITCAIVSDGRRWSEGPVGLTAGALACPPSPLLNDAFMLSVGVVAPSASCSGGGGGSDGRRSIISSSVG